MIKAENVRSMREVIECARLAWDAADLCGEETDMIFARTISAALNAWPKAVFAIEANNAPCILLPLTEPINDKG